MHACKIDTGENGRNSLKSCLQPCIYNHNPLQFIFDFRTVHVSQTQYFSIRQRSHECSFWSCALFTCTIELRYFYAKLVLVLACAHTICINMQFKYICCTMCTVLHARGTPINPRMRSRSWTACRVIERAKCGRALQLNCN